MDVGDETAALSQSQGRITSEYGARGGGFTAQWVKVWKKGVTPKGRLLGFCSEPQESLAIKRLHFRKRKVPGFQRRFTKKREDYSQFGTKGALPSVRKQQSFQFPYSWYSTMVRELREKKKG